MAGKVAVEMDAVGKIKPSKRRSTERIDGIVTLIMAMGRAMAQPVKELSRLAERGLPVWVIGI